MSKLRNDLGHLLKSSYLPQKEAAEKLKKLGYDYDHELSRMDTKVLTKNGEPVIVHRGAKTVRDWLDDGLLAVGLEKYSKRFNDAQKITKQVEDKYKKPASSVGHSLGGGKSGQIMRTLFLPSKTFYYAIVWVPVQCTRRVPDFRKSVTIGAETFQSTEKSRQIGAEKVHQ